MRAESLKYFFLKQTPSNPDIIVHSTTGNNARLRGRMDFKDRRVREIQENIRQILLHDWDPIGISGVPEAQDEYDGYVGKVYSLLASKVPLDKIVGLLSEIETESMELTPDMERIQNAAIKLCKIDISL